MGKIEQENQYEAEREKTEEKAAQIAEIATAFAKRENEDANVTGMNILHQDALVMDEQKEYDLKEMIDSLSSLMELYSKCQVDANYLENEHQKGRFTEISDAEDVYDSILENCPELKTDKALIKKMIEINRPWRFLKDIDSSLLADESFLLDLIKMNKLTLNYLPDQTRKDFQFIEKAIKVNSEIILQDLAYLDPEDYRLLERTLEE